MYPLTILTVFDVLRPALQRSRVSKFINDGNGGGGHLRPLLPGDPAVLAILGAPRLFASPANNDGVVFCLIATVRRIKTGIIHIDGCATLLALACGGLQERLGALTLPKLGAAKSVKSGGCLHSTPAAKSRSIREEESASGACLQYDPLLAPGEGAGDARGRISGAPVATGVGALASYRSEGARAAEVIGVHHEWRE